MGLIATFALVLLLAFWVIGARNRLVRLRQAVGQAFLPLELQLRKRHALARHLAEALRHGALQPREHIEAVMAAATQAHAAVDALRGRATDATPMRKLASAEEVLANALQGLLPAPAPFATADDTAPPPEPADPAVAELQARLLQLHPPLDYARQAYNGKVQVYNAALRLFPTTLVATLCRFDPAAMLPRLSKAAA